MIIIYLESADLCIAIQAGTGRFELCLNNKLILTGNIFVLDNFNFNKKSMVHINGDNNTRTPIVSLNSDEVYSSIEQFGYCVGEVFKTIKCVNIFEDGMRWLFGYRLMTRYC